MLESRISPEAPFVAYAAYTEISGPGPFEAWSGLFEVSMWARAVDQTTGPVTVRLGVRSTSNPDLQSFDDITLNGTMEMRTGVHLPAWTHCSFPPCGEDFEVTIELLHPTSSPMIDIGATLYIHGQGDNYDLERTTQVRLEARKL